MTTALILLALTTAVALLVAAVSRAIAGGGSPTRPPRHAERDWSTDRLPSEPWNRLPRLP